MRGQHRQLDAQAVGLHVVRARFGQGSAAAGMGAELAPGAGLVLALALRGQLGHGLDLLAPGQQLLRCQLVRAHVIDAGLIDVQADLLDVVGEAVVV